MGLFESKPCAQCAEKQAEIDRLWAFITGMRAITMSPAAIATTSTPVYTHGPVKQTTTAEPWAGDFRRNTVSVVDIVHEQQEE